MVCCHGNSRFSLGLRPGTASNNSLFHRKAGALGRNAQAVPDTFSIETLLVPAEASRSSLFILSSRNERNFRPLVSISCALLFTLLQKGGPAISLLFNHFHTLRKEEEYPGVGYAPSLRQNTFISQPPPATRATGAKRTDRPSQRTGTGRDSLARYVFLSSHRYFLTPAEKPYPTPCHLMAKRYRTAE